MEEMTENQKQDFVKSCPTRVFKYNEGAQAVEVSMHDTYFFYGWLLIRGRLKILSDVFIAWNARRRQNILKRMVLYLLFRSKISSISLWR